MKYTHVFTGKVSYWPESTLAWTKCSFYMVDVISLDFAQPVHIYNLKEIKIQG